MYILYIFNNDIYMCVCVPFITDRHYMTLYIIIVDMF